MSMAVSPQFFDGAVVVMGVTACGKTTVGIALAKAIGARFTEGDALHPEANIKKMSAGIPLDDDDRWPWLAKVGESLKGPGGKVTSCSALKRSYRQRIVQFAQRPVAFVLLHGSEKLLATRIAARKGHFMPPSMLASQLATLEIPGEDELSITIDIAKPIEQQVSEAKAWLQRIAPSLPAQ